MISTTLFDSQAQSLQTLQGNISKYCPQLKVCGSSSSLAEATQHIHHYEPSLVFIEVCPFNNQGLQMLHQIERKNFEIIFLSKSSDCAMKAFKYQASGFILKPIQLEDLILAVKNAEDCIVQKQKQVESQRLLQQMLHKLPPGDLIGMPTLEGYEFIPIHEIFRLESFQNCTRIITKKRKDIISSYNIGEFKKRLEPFYFFSPHKSHLINLIHIKKYYKEGTIQMSDDSYVPVSKRRKSQFLRIMLLSR